MVGSLGSYSHDVCSPFAKNGNLTWNLQWKMSDTDLPRASLYKHTLPQFEKSALFLATWNKTSYFDPGFWNLKTYALSILCDIHFNKLTNYFGKCDFFSGSKWVF